MSVAASAEISTCRAQRRVVLLAIALAAALLLVSDAPGQRRPGRHPEFSQGFRAVDREDWDEAADRMLEALVVWDEDGELTRVYGRWPEPYLPRYYRGVALYELGCYQLSLDQLNKTILGKREIRYTRRELEELASVKLKCERFVLDGVYEKLGSDCSRHREASAAGEAEDD